MAELKEGDETEISPGNAAVASDECTSPRSCSSVSNNSDSLKDINDVINESADLETESDSEGVKDKDCKLHKISKCKKKNPEGSTSVNSNENSLDMLSLQMSCLQCLGDLKSKTSSWNNKSARKIYHAFKVKRFIVENNFIFAPINGRKDMCIANLLEKSFDLLNPKCRWSYFEPRLTKVLEIYTEELSDLVHSLDDEAKFKESFAAWKKKKRRYRMGDHGLEDIMTDIEEFLEVFLVEVGKFVANPWQSIPERFYERYFQQLLYLFSRLADGAGSLILTKSILSSCSFTVPKTKLVCRPKPDFYLTDNKDTLFAVVQVKPHNKPRINHPVVPVEVNRTKTDNWKEDVETHDDDHLNDRFEISECQLEKEQNVGIPKYLRALEIKEKKQVRRFLPQLLGQLLACHSTHERVVTFFDTPYQPLRVGISLVGFKLRFITLVVKDSYKKIKYPTAEDIIREPSVRPYVYLTRELNLMKRNHLLMFFEILFALGTIP